MKRTKKLLSLLLALSLVLATFIPSAWAEGPAPADTDLTASYVSVDGVSYVDVDVNAPYANAVQLLLENGIMVGIGNNLFAPEMEVTRAQAITVLASLAGAEKEVTDDFSDVPADAWYAGYVGWAVDNGIVVGDGEGHFMPDQLVTSAHLNLMLSHYAEMIGREMTFYDTAGKTVTRADLAQRLVAFLEEPAPDPEPDPEPSPEPSQDSTVTIPVRVPVTSSGEAGGEPAMTSSGYIMGYRDRDVYTFMGIQYGTARRFENPQPYNVFNDESLYSDDPALPTLALVRGAASPQAKTNTVYSDGFGFAQFMTPSGSDMYGVESECLNLNVWTNSMDSNAKKPVLVFMHGGGTASDSANGLEVYDGHALARDTDLVFVTVNARLGTLGYSTDFSSLGGGNNLAIRDMLLSLEWVKENIATFGGDPNNVTIMGQSGGGSKVGDLATSPYADEHNLFQKVVLTSASANGSGATTPQETRDEAAQAMADRMRNGGDVTTRRFNYETWQYETVTTHVDPVEGFDANTTDAEILAYLQSFRTDEISSVLSQYGYSGGLTSDGTILDGLWNNGTDGLTEHAAKYTYLIGSTWAEMKGGNSVEAIQNRMYDRAKCNMTDEQKEALMAEIYGDDLARAKELFAAAYPGVDFYNLRSLVDGRGSFSGSRNFYNASAIATKSTTVYEYLVAYEMPYFGGTTMLHTADLALWFNSLDNVPYQFAGDETNAHKVADTMSSALAAFCASGNPSTPELEWKAHDQESEWIMVLNTESQLREGTYDDELLALMAEHNG